MRRTISTIPGSLVNLGVADKMATSVCIDPSPGVAELTEVGSAGASLRKVLLQKLKREGLSVHERILLRTLLRALVQMPFRWLPHTPLLAF